MKVWYRKLKGTNVIFVAKHITFLSLGKKRRLLRLEATMPHPQQLKKKRKKGNTKVERSRELQNSSIPTFFCFDFSGKQSFFFLDVADFSVFICVRPFLRQTFQWFISRSKSRGVNFWVRHDKRGCFLTCVVANRSYYEPPTPLSQTIVC